MLGKVFGRWTVVSYAGKAHWNCRCECGGEGRVHGHYLRRGASRSCGCLQKELLVKRAKTHGGKRRSEYKIWDGMKQRCLNPNHTYYSEYGGRGITICERWRKSFVEFLNDVGPRPSRKHTLDRKDNDGNYEPGNVRWATRIEQENNKRSNRLLTFQGVTLSLSEMARRHNLTAGQLFDRLSYGWSIDKALTQPIRQRATPCKQ